MSFSTCDDVNSTVRLFKYNSNQRIFTGKHKDLVRFCTKNPGACETALNVERRYAQDGKDKYGISDSCASTVYNQGRALLADNQPRRLAFLVFAGGGVALYGLGTWALGLPTEAVSVPGLAALGAMYAMYAGALKRMTNYDLGDAGGEALAGALHAAYSMRQWFATAFNGQQLNQCPSADAVQNLMELGQLYQD